MTSNKQEKLKEEISLPHPGELGDHPLGGAVGAAVGAIAAAAVGAAEGANIGSVTGLTGMVTGAVIGGVAGALAGKEVAQIINPNEEEIYWRDQHKNQSYFDSTVSYDSYAPAYRFGIEAYTTYVGRDFDQIEAQLGKQWNDLSGDSRLTWKTARLATRDAYERLCKRAA